MKKFLLPVAGCIAMLFFFTSCTQSGSKKNKDTVRINISSEPDSLDPLLSAAADTASIFHNVFDSLLLCDPTGKIIPGIASSYNVSADKMTYTFYLNRDVIFHNGKKLTGSDVLYTYNRLVGLNGKTPVSAKFKNVVSLSVPDPYMFSVRLSVPDATFLSLAATTAILPEGYTEQATYPVGAGPFKFVDFTPGQRIVLERNDSYYNKKRLPQIKRVEIYIMTSEAAVISALRSGQLDAAYFITGNDADALKNSFSVYSAPQNMIQIFGLNNSVKPFNDIRVRQAFCYAVDKKDVINGVFDGYATELYTNFSPVMKEFYNDKLSDYYKTDRVKAKQLLSEAGYPNGFDMTITVPSNYEPHVNTAQILASQLSQIGIRVKLEQVEWATWLDKVYSKAQYQSTVIAFDGKIDPDDILRRYTIAYPKNFIKFSNLEFDNCIQKAGVETDPYKRVSLYKEAQKILTNQAASVFICDPNLIVATRKDLKGYTFYPVTFIDFSSLYYE